MGEITNLNPACKTGGVKNYVYTSFFEDKKISLTAMPLSGGEFWACAGKKGRGLQSYARKSFITKKGVLMYREYRFSRKTYMFMNFDIFYH